MKEFSGDEAERLLLHLYTGLPLLPAAEDGARSAVLARFGPYEVRLTEFPPDNMPFLPLWVELFRDSGRELVDELRLLRDRGCRRGRARARGGGATAAQRELIYAAPGTALPVGSSREVRSAFRRCEGASPVQRLKACVKALASWKPRSQAMCEIESAGSSR